MSSLYAPVPLGLRRFGRWRWCHRGWRRSHRGRRWRCVRGRGMGRTWNNDARCLRARRAPCKGQQRDVARPLDGHAEPALMTRAHARHPPRQNLPALLHELRQDVRALVVDEVHLLDAELAHLLLAEILALTSGPSSRTARAASAWAAFAPRATVPAARTAVASMTTGTGAAFTPRSSSRRWCLFLFLCHTFHPFNRRPGLAGTNLLVTLARPESLFSMRKISSARGTNWLPQPAPALAPLGREPASCGADAVRHASRASAKVSSGA